MMKVIVTGATGKIGSEVLHQCLKTPSITMVYALTRRPIDPEIVSANASRLKNIIHADFTTYPDSLLDQLSGADTCLWALGDIGAKDHRTVDITFTLNAAKAFVSTLQPRLSDGQKFKFLYVSGLLAEQDQEKSLWLVPELRRFKGEAELKLLELERSNSDHFQVFFVRPGYVATSGSGIPSALARLLRLIRQDQLAAAMIEVATNGFRTQIVYNNDLLDLGTARLAQE